MYIVYSQHIKTGKQLCLVRYETAEDALGKIISCYKIDERLGQSGEYYYFMKKI